MREESTLDRDESSDEPPDVPELERSIREHRRDLVEHVQELENVVRAKLDVKAKLRVVPEHIELAVLRVVDRILARPTPYLVVGGLVLLLLGRRAVRSILR